jgi:superoxide dismutase, Cu-Zn family
LWNLSGREKTLRKRKIASLGMFGALLLALFAGGALAQGAGTATAQLEDNDGNSIGDATFTEGPNGVTINANLQPGQQGVEPGEHGIHIHETGEISPDFEAAGEHFNPTSAQHGFNNSEGPHGGDLENMIVNDDGSASYTTTTDALTLSGGQNSILDSDGSALVIYQSADDYQTDPSGESGDRVAAGVIRESATGESTAAGGTTSAPLPKSGGPTSLSGLLLPAAALLVGSGVLAYAILRRR